MGTFPVYNKLHRLSRDESQSPRFKIGTKRILFSEKRPQSGSRPFLKQESEPAYSDD